MLSGVQVRGAVARALMSRPVVHALEPLTRRRLRHLGVTVSSNPALVSPYTRAEVFWGIYERTECTYIDRYLRGSTFVIELGAGIGVTTAHIRAAIAPAGRLVSVEANPAFAADLRRRRADIEVVNVAIAGADGDGVIGLTENPFRSRIDAANGVVTPVAMRTLASLVDELSPARFDLVCDIEGAEGEFVAGAAPSGLERCRTVVIELHECTVSGAGLTVEDLLALLRDRWGFSVLARKGPVIAAVR
jgi:FkbM family methyltransferase